jgi:SulP family sulfate permease
VNLSRTVKRFWSQSAFDSLKTKRVRFLPVLADLRTYHRKTFNHDARVGLLVALLALPQGLALALIAGLPPEHGVYAAIAGMAAGALFAGVRHASIGPSVTTAVLLFSMFVRHGISPEERVEAVALLLAFTAVILVVAAWFRLAQLTRYVSRSVTIGFITAAAVLIYGSQLKHVLGLDLPDSGVFLEDVRLLLGGVHETRWPALLVGSITAGVYLAVSLRARRWPAALLGVLAGTATAMLLEQSGFATARLEAIARELPPAAGALHLAWSGVIAQAALATALVTHLEVSMIGRAFAARSGDAYDANQQVYGLGLAQFANALFAGLPASASLERTRVLRRQRVRTPLAGVFAALFCAALFLAVAPWLALVPRAALAALALMLATEVVSRHYLRVILRSSGADAVVLLGTLAAGLIFRLDVALYLGAGLSILFFLRKVGVPEMTEFGFNEQGQLAAVTESGATRTPDISIVHVEGNLFFGAAEIFYEQARRVFEDPNLKIIVLRMKNAHHLDATCALAIEELLRFAKENGRHVIVSGAHRAIFRVFRSSGLLDLLGRENFFMHVPSNPTLSTRNALKRAQVLLGSREANIRIYVDSARGPKAERTEP